jgi:hypothetical protein
MDLPGACKRAIDQMPEIARTSPEVPWGGRPGSSRKLELDITTLPVQRVLRLMLVFREAGD